MMSKPRPSEETKQTPSAKMPANSKPKSATDAVEDLERRLALLGAADSSNPPPADIFPAAVEEMVLPTSSVAEPAAPPMDAALGVGVPLKGGKNALLVRL